MLHGLVYETLLGLHPTTLEYIPALATHWQISPDKLTFRFRIDPNARFTTARRSRRTMSSRRWKLLTDKRLQDPAQNADLREVRTAGRREQVHRPVRPRTAELAELYCTSRGMLIFPAHVLKDVDGAALHQRLQLQDAAGHRSVHRRREQDVDQGQRRSRSAGATTTGRRSIAATSASSNFDEIREIVVRDRNLEFEMLKRGDLDYYLVTARADVGRRS